MYELYRIGAIATFKSMGKLLSGFEILKTREEKKAYVASKINKFKVIKDNILKVPTMKAAARLIQKRVRATKDKQWQETRFSVHR